MAVKVDRGTSEIRFEYKTPGLVNGLMITGGACVLLLLYILIFTLYSKKHPTETCYPEGDMLIAKWRLEDREDARRLLAERFEDGAKESILSDDAEIEIPHMENGFSGGFKIDSELFDDKEDEE